MPKVIVLPDHVASQIAAGEVVERPSSVVKELVENSIDAGATQIEIAISSQCRDIRIADNGCGMAAEDVVLAFQRHATSKLKTADDLFALHSLGFRGEALPSIASVSKVTCFTRTEDAETGTRVDAADGVVTARETGCAVGTAIEVSDLFYNVPARLGFLKKPSTEFGHINETVQSLALAYPKVIFQLLNQGEVILRTSGSGKLAQVMKEIGMLTGKEELITVTHADLRQSLAVYGYVARAPHCRGDRKGIQTIVNNRPVRCALTFKALDHAFTDLIPKGKHPVGVITLTLDPKEIDVNVHPTKKEIKYSNSNDVYLAIYHGLKDSIYSSRAREAAEALEYAAESETKTTGNATESRALQDTPRVRESVAVALTAASTQSSSLPTENYSKRNTQQLSLRERLAVEPTPSPTRPGVSGDPIFPTRPRTPASLPLGWRTIGYMHNTYILVETPEGLRIVEQHIAHERVIYERILGQQETAGRISEMSQRLVISAPLNLTAEQVACLQDNIECLRNLGFDFETQDNLVSCTQVPLELATKDYASSVQSNVEQLLAVDQAHFDLEATKSLACQAAIKNGMPLSEAEITELLCEWHKCPRNDSCPHGRPISLEFSRDKLFQLFHPK